MKELLGPSEMENSPLYYILRTLARFKGIGEQFRRKGVVAAGAKSNPSFDYKAIIRQELNSDTGNENFGTRTDS